MEAAVASRGATLLKVQRFAIALHLLARPFNIPRTRRIVARALDSLSRILGNEILTVETERIVGTPNFLVYNWAFFAVNRASR